MIRHNQPTDIPGTVKAIIAKKNGSLQHQAMAKVKNEEQTKVAGQFLHRIHNVVN